MDRDFTEAGLRRGDTILVYTSYGEGVVSAWFNGRFYPEFDVSFACDPRDSGGYGAHCAGTYTDGKDAWWAQVETQRGVTGWVMARPGGGFLGTDLLE
jgi:hypothetical protein